MTNQEHTDSLLEIPRNLYNDTLLNRLMLENDFRHLHRLIWPIIETLTERDTETMENLFADLFDDDNFECFCETRLNFTTYQVVGFSACYRLSKSIRMELTFDAMIFEIDTHEPTFSSKGDRYTVWFSYSQRHDIREVINNMFFEQLRLRGKRRDNE